jgi:hypothetical protein
MNDGMPSKPKLDLVALDCPDAFALAQFDAEVLGWDIEQGVSRESSVEKFQRYLGPCVVVCSRLRGWTRCRR